MVFDAKPSFIAGHKKQVYSLSWNCNGDKLASGSADSTVKVWKYHSTGKFSDKADAEFKGHTEAVNAVCFHPEASDIAISASDKSVRMWDSKTGKQLANVPNIPQVHCIAWHPSGRDVAVATQEGQLVTIDTRKYKPTKTCKLRNAANGIAWHRNGKVLFFGTNEGTLEVVQYPSLEQIWQLQAHSSGCYSLAISPDMKHVATGGGDALLALWGLDDMMCAATSIRPELPVRSVAFSHDSALLAYAASDPFVDVLDSTTGEVMGRVSGAVKDDVTINVDTVAWSPKRGMLAFAGGDPKGSGSQERDRAGYGARESLRDYQGIIGLCAVGR